jgi:DNA-binding transcriptional ArsR family regulator
MRESRDGPEYADDAAEAGATPRLSDDRLYRALASTRRRRVLYVLLDRGESTVDEIATVLVGWDATETGGMSSPDDHRRTVIGLRHSDLPLLEDAGLLSHDRAGGTVTIEPLRAEVTELVVASVEGDRASGS